LVIISEMKNKKYIFLSFLISTILLGTLLNAAEDTNETKSKEWIILPFAFSSDSTGFAAGISAMKEGIFQ